MPLDALDALGARPGGLDEFRITSAREILATLRQLQQGNVRLHLNRGSGSGSGHSRHSLPVTVWSVEDEHIGFSIDINVSATDASLLELLEGDDVVAVGCVDAVKLQFEARAMVLVHGARASVLRCACPREMFRFQRRSAFRVQPLGRDTPLARLCPGGDAHRPSSATNSSVALALRVLDVSIGGCALFLPANLPAKLPEMAAGSVIRQVEVTLDADTRFHVDLRLQHSTSLNLESGGVRLGCEFVNADSATLRALQRFIDQTQKRSRMLAVL